MYKSPAILSVSFRPFFILVALIAVFNPVFWVLFYSGKIQFTLHNVSPLFWHGHEMIFGFSGAMIAGFILTASAHWTNSKPYSGMALFGLLSIWLIERLSFFLPIEKDILFGLSNLFLPVLALMVLAKLYGFAKQKYVFVPILLVLTSAKLFHSWGYLFGSDSLELLGKELATGVLRLIVLLIAGRVIPFFTSKKLDLKIVVPPWLNLLSLLSVALLIIPWEQVLSNWIAVPILALAIFSNILRQVKWRPEKTIRVPILFILHIGIAFISLNLISELLAIYFPMVGMAHVPLHILMAAGVGTVGIGIMSRVSLGHTGRVIVADRWVCLAYLLIVLGGLLRAGGPILFSSFYLNSLIMSAALWSGGFLIFLLRFFTILVTPRPDGK